MNTLCAGQKAHYDLHRNISRMRSELFVQEEKMAFDFGQGEFTQAELGDASVHPFWKEKKQTEDRAMKDGKPNETEKRSHNRALMRGKLLLVTWKKTIWMPIG